MRLMTPADPNRGLLAALIDDGRPLLIFIGVCLALAGAFALFLSVTRQFLPHDVQYLGMTAEQLCGIQNCHVAYFMFHDRVSFGGALIAIGALYVWLAEFPLRNGEAWSWWLFFVSSVAGFGSFLAYLGYGYLDTWHGIATLGLIPFFVVGLAKSRALIEAPASISVLTKSAWKVTWLSRDGIGRALLLATAAGMIAGGLTIMTVGMTTVFVPQDISFIGVAANNLRSINPRLLPLIAHDRAGFGGGICTTGITVLFSVWCARPSRSLWQVLCFAGTVGFGTAIGVHPAVGYNNMFHLAPAVIGAAAFIAGMVLCYRPMVKSGNPQI
jgi:hypothetical protein